MDRRNPALEALIVREAREAVGPALREAILFGSRARGDWREGSDWDVALVVDGMDKGEALNRAGRAAGTLLAEHGALVGFVVLDADQRTWPPMLGLNIEDEGVSLWRRTLSPARSKPIEISTSDANSSC